MIRQLSNHCVRNCVINHGKRNNNSIYPLLSNLRNNVSYANECYHSTNMICTKIVDTSTTNQIRHYHTKKQRNTKKASWRPKKEKHTLLGVNTEWIRVSDIPPLSTLDELLVDIERIMQTELRTGIVDLDAAEKIVLNQAKTQGKEDEENIITSPPLPLWNPHNDGSIPSHMVIEAHLHLSTLYRQAGWFLRFPSRSCVQALLSHVQEADRIRNNYYEDRKTLRRRKFKRQYDETYDNDNDNNDLDTKRFSWVNYSVRPLTCCWKEVLVNPFFLNADMYHTKIDWIDENVVRVENCPPESTVDDIRYVFNPYDLLDDRIIADGQNSISAVHLAVSGCKDVEKEKKHLKGDTPTFTPSRTNTFLVQFTTSAGARAAVREKQNVELMGKKIRLAQFSRQIIS